MSLRVCLRGSEIGKAWPDTDDEMLGGSETSLKSVPTVAPALVAFPSEWKLQTLHTPSKALRTEDMYVPQVEEMVPCQEAMAVWTWDMPNLPEEKASPSGCEFFL